MSCSCGFSLNYKGETSNYDKNYKKYIITKEGVFDSYYNHKVQLRLMYYEPDHFLETVHNDVHIKIIDAEKNDLNINITYSLEYLLQLDSVKYTGKSYYVDVIFGIIQYFDFLKTMDIEFQIPLVIALVNIPDLENAFWNGSYLTFGNGSQSPIPSPLSPRHQESFDDYSFSPRRIIRPLTSSMIVAHELSHALIQYICNLEYKGHSGALNESFSDIIGVCLEEYILNKYRSIGYEIGSELYEHSALRSMEKPHKYSQPEKMYDQYYVNPNSMVDYGGVHINSGIINNIFYELCLIMTKKEALSIFINILFQLKKNSNFYDFKALLITELNMSDMDIKTLNDLTHLIKDKIK